MNKLLGDEVVKNNGDKVSVSSLSGEGKVVGIYFSAHWCPPCRGFTPVLADWYKKFKQGPNGDNFDIVFVSSDRDPSSFDEYFKEMPWLALPYSERDKKAELSKKFKVQGIPTLVMVNAASGLLITADGRAIVNDDPEGKDFPWVPKPFLEVIDGIYLKKVGEEEKGLKEAIKGKVIGLYFSAHWCGPCRSFTPQLTKSYQKIVADKKNFEIIFCSSDRDEDSFKEYYNEMPWLSIPFGDSRKKLLSRMFDISGIPTLVIIDENGKTITTNGRAAVSGDADGAKFPWHPEPVNKLTGNTASDINDYASLIWFCEKNNGQLELLTPIAKEWIQKWNDTGNEREMAFFVSYKDDEDDEDGIRDSLKNFVGLTGENMLAIVDVPSQKVYECGESDVTIDGVKKFVKSYFDMSLKSRPLRS